MTASPTKPRSGQTLTRSADMNERIGKLVEQAEEWVCKNYPDAMDDNDEFHAQTMAKFAELIVRDCQSRVEQYIYHRGGVTSMPDTVLIKHFGVEL